MWASLPARSMSTLTECQVVYPEGLNGALELVVTSLPESLTHRMNMLNKPTFLLVDLSQFITGDNVPEASAPHYTSSTISSTHLTMEQLPRGQWPHQHDC